MTSKERVRRAALYDEVDRLPATTYATTYEYEMRMAKSLGLASLEQMYVALGLDIWRNRELPVCLGPLPKGRLFEDVHTLDGVEAAKFPYKYDVKAAGAEMEAHKTYSILAGTIPEGFTPGIWHLYLDMCGQENGLCYLEEQPEIARAMIRRITDYWVGYMKAVLETGMVDIWCDMNDFGTQQSLFISPKHFREFIKPELKLMVAVAHEYGAMYMQHSCGAIYPLIEDFVEMGVDILNPIQVTARGMKMGILRRDYYGSIAFCGGIDTQQFLRKAGVDEVRMEVRKMKRMFNTGYILCGSHELKDDIPVVNAVAMFDENMR